MDGMAFDEAALDADESQRLGAGVVPALEAFPGVAQATGIGGLIE
jgi:hypothetical protein